ncbi:MAG: hypothetical protein P8176_11685, partial [Gammaproteobacteria bacterium]
MRQAIPDAMPEELAELLQLRLQKQHTPPASEQAFPKLLKRGASKRKSQRLKPGSLAQSDYPPATLDLPFLNLVASTRVEPENRSEFVQLPDWYDKTTPFQDEVDSPMPDELSRPEPLMPWQSLWPVLRTLFCDRKKTRRLDVKKIIKKKIKQQALIEIPWQYKPCWPTELILIVDFSRHLRPFFADFVAIAQQLMRWFGKRLHVYSCLDAEDQRYDYRGRTFRGFPLKSNKAEILYIGDLGLLHPERITSSCWYFLGKSLKRNQAHVETILVAHPREWNRELQRYFNHHAWNENLLLSASCCVVSQQDHRGKAKAIDAQNKEQTENLLAYLSWTFELMPDVVRAARRALGYHASVESRLIHHPALRGNVTFQWNSVAQRDVYRERFQRLEDEGNYDREAMWRLIQPFETQMPMELQIEQRQQLGKPLLQTHKSFLQCLVKSEREGTLDEMQHEMLLDWVGR